MIFLSSLVQKTLRLCSDGRVRLCVSRGAVESHPETKPRVSVPWSNIWWKWMKAAADVSVLIHTLWACFLSVINPFYRARLVTDHLHWCMFNPPSILLCIIIDTYLYLLWITLSLFPDVQMDSDSEGRFTEEDKERLKEKSFESKWQHYFKSQTSSRESMQFCSS